MPPGDDEPDLAGGGSPTAATGYAVRQIADSIGRGIDDAMDKIINAVTNKLNQALGGGGTNVGAPHSVPPGNFSDVPNGGRGAGVTPRGTFNPMPMVAFGTAAAHRVEMGMRPQRQEVELMAQSSALASGRGGGQQATWASFNDISRNRSITGFTDRLDRAAGVASIQAVSGYATNSRQFNRMAAGVSALSLMNPQLGYGGSAQAMQQQYGGGAIQQQIRVGAPTFTGIGGRSRNAAVVNREAIQWAAGGRMLGSQEFAATTTMNGRVRRNLTSMYGEEAAGVMITQGRYETSFRERSGRNINWSSRADRRAAGVEDTEYRTFQRTQEALARGGDTMLQGESSAMKRVQRAAEGAAVALEKIARLGNGGVGGLAGQVMGYGGALAGPAALGTALSGGGGGGGAGGGFLSGVAGSLAGRALFAKLAGGGAAAAGGGALTAGAGVLTAAGVGAGVGTAIQRSKTWRNGVGNRLENWMSTALFKNDGSFGIGETGGPGAEGASGSGGSSINMLKDLVSKSGVSHRVTSTTGGKHSKNSAHYRGQAIDIAGPKPGKDTDEMRKIANYLADNYGSALSELIYAGPGAKNIKNGKPHNYSKAVLDDHHDHIHVAADPAKLANASGLSMESNVGGGDGSGGGKSGNGEGGSGSMSLPSISAAFKASGLKGWSPTAGTYGKSGGGETQGSGSGSAPTSGAPTGNVGQWISEALGILGLDSTKYGKAIETIIMKESGGNPKAQNNWDSNAKKGTPSKGVMQTIDSTFQAHKLPGHDDIWNPVDNIIAATRYAIKRYGSIDNVPGVKAMREGKPYKGYKKGAWEIESDQMAYIHKGEMVVPEKDAAAIRAASKNPFMKTDGGGGGGNMIFQPGSIVLHGVSEDDARKFWQMVKAEKAKDDRYSTIGAS